MSKFFVVLGRACLGLIFVLAAVQEMMHWEDALQRFLLMLNSSVNFFVKTSWLHDFLSFLAPYATLIMLIAILFKVLGGFLVIFGIKVRFGAVLLILFLIPSTFLFHNFWALTGDEQGLQLIMFLKNLSVFGGLLILLGTAGGSAKSAAAHK